MGLVQGLVSSEESRMRAHGEGLCDHRGRAWGLQAERARGKPEWLRGAPPARTWGPAPWPPALRENGFLSC